MTRLIHLIQLPALVNVTFLGPVSFSDRIEMIEPVRPLVEKHGLQGLLLDYTQAWVGESPMGAFEELEALLRASTWLEGLRVALVSPADFHALPIEPLDEVGYEIRRFYTRPAAIAWLAEAARQAQVAEEIAIDGRMRTCHGGRFRPKADIDKPESRSPRGP